MITFAFVARCAEESIQLEVKLAYQPGKQAQRARRVAVGELLAVLECESATVDASGTDRVTVQTAQGVWVIGESYSPKETRGKR